MQIKVPTKPLSAHATALLLRPVSCSLLSVVLVFMVSCSKVSSDDARLIAYKRLSALEEGPGLDDDGILRGLQVESQKDGMYLVTLEDRATRVWWAVIVKSNGESDISRMSFDN